MQAGHRQAQEVFAEIGRARGYQTRRTFTPDLPTDGIWLAPVTATISVPLVALEVASSERGKRLAGSIATLERVSPALGVLVIHEDDWDRGAVRRGASSNQSDQELHRLRATAAALAATSRQRIEVWSFAYLLWLYRMATGRSFLISEGGTS